MPVALTIQHAMRMRPFVLSYVACLAQPYCSKLSHKVRIFEKKKFFLLIPQSFDWLAAFHLELLQAILSIVV